MHSASAEPYLLIPMNLVGKDFCPLTYPWISKLAHTHTLMGFKSIEFHVTGTYCPLYSSATSCTNMHGRIQGYSLVFLGIPNYFGTPLCIYDYILICIYMYNMMWKWNTQVSNSSSAIANMRHCRPLAPSCTLGELKSPCTIPFHHRSSMFGSSFSYGINIGEDWSPPPACLNGRSACLNVA
jgi:hypothetical protein